MSGLARVSALVAFALLMGVGLLSGDDPRVVTRTSFGQVPAGHAALYEVLAASGVPVARSFAPVERLAPGQTIWWIEPDDLVGEQDVPAPDPSGMPATSPISGEALAAWIIAGGTAVVLLPAERAGDDAQLLLARLEVPATDTLAAIEAKRTGAAPQPASDTAAAAPAPRVATVRGAIVSGSRAIELPDPVVFAAEADPAHWRVVAELDGRPFALASEVGAGRLAVIADARFVSNAWLDHADAAPLAADLVRAYGDPWIDEHEHGLVASRSAIGYLARSSALPFFLGLALLAITFVWFGAAVPPRTVRERDPSAPTLENFVASMAQLYAKTGDYTRVLARYRELTARRLRRHLGMPPDAPIASLVERLARRRGFSAAGLELLSHGAPVRSAPELERAAAALDRLVKEAAA